MTMDLSEQRSNSMPSNRPGDAFDAREYWEDRLAQDYSLQGVGFYTLPRSFNRWAYASRRAVFRRTVRRAAINRTEASVLDVGSGTGVYVREWERLGVKQITGADITEVAVEGLRKKFPSHTFHCLDISEGNRLLTGQFDAISCMDVLFHVVDDERYEASLRNLVAMLRPGGVLILSDGLLRQPAIRHRHVVFRPSKMTMRVLEEAGCTRVASGAWFVLMNEPIDSNHPIPAFAWRIVHKVASFGERIGWLTGAVLFPVEVLLTAIVRPGPSAKIIAMKQGRRREPHNPHEQ